MNRILVASLLAGAAGLSLGHAEAHISLLSPSPRTAELKKGPCGVLNGTKGANVTAFEPGQTITVSWAETINHPGHYRISFDDDGDDDFVNPASFDDVSGCLMDLVSDLRAADPERIFQDRGVLQQARMAAREELSSLEHSVLRGYLEGRTYQEMARAFCREPKAIDNALQRAKRKVGARLAERN